MKMNNKRYIVTKGSDCGTLLKGDHIRIYDDGTVLCVEAGGWLNKEDSAVVLETVEFESIKYRCVCFDIDPFTGDEINHLWLEEDRPEKIYKDRVDNYGDIRDNWRILK